MAKSNNHTTRVYNWGIIGMGRIAHKFAQDLQLLPNARLWAVASQDAARAAAFAHQYKAPHHYGSYEGILSCPELDVVYIATPHVTHCANTLMCLEAGIPVLCEKPLAMNAAEAESMVQTAQQRQVFLMEAMWTRFLPATLQMLKWIEEGRIGEVISVKADFGFRAPYDPQGRIYNKALGGGALLDIGIYPAFLSLLLLEPPTTIKALAHIGSTGVDLEVGAVMSFPGGRMAHLHTTVLANTKTEAFVYGSEGTIHLHTRWHHASSLSLLKEGKRPEEVHFDEKGVGYHYEATEVMRCLDLGLKESPLLPLSFSRQLMQLLDDILLAVSS
ncbi:MAG: Gfo/Idh/MocA family oxidoreductase [Saprospiraceae bacterium]|jgi:predicted dehydrogenase|nr:Gfo/Idh/MocA family oxidoreductase [Saprospiraceae bacterium]